MIALAVVDVQVGTPLGSRLRNGRKVQGTQPVIARIQQESVKHGFAELELLHLGHGCANAHVACECREAVVGLNVKTLGQLARTVTVFGRDRSEVVGRGHALGTGTAIEGYPTNQRVRAICQRRAVGRYITHTRRCDAEH